MKKNISAAVASTNGYEALEDWARSRPKSGYRSCLRTKSRSFWVGKSRSGSPNRRGYRNGHGEPRRFAMMNGTMEVRRPRVRNTADRFESQILPYFRRKSKQLGELLADLYLHGLATGDFEQAMRGLLGAGAPCVASIEGCKPMNNTQVVVSWPSEPRESTMASTDGSPSLKRWPNGAAFG